MAHRTSAGLLKRVLTLHVGPLQAQAAPQAAAQAGKQQPEGGAFPPMTGDDVQRYQGMFAKLDTDRDGYVMVGAQSNRSPSFLTPEILPDTPGALDDELRW
jgi:hypothetical protein